MITTTLFRREEIYDKKNENKKSKIFTDGIREGILWEKIPPTDVAICTGAKTSKLYKKGGTWVRDCTFLTEESLKDLNNKWMNDCEQGLYPCFRFSDVSELVEELGVSELEDYESGIKKGIVYIPTYGKDFEENNKLLKKIESGELREIDENEAYFPTNEYYSFYDRLRNRYGIKVNKYYVDQKGRMFLKIKVNPIYDKYRDRDRGMCELYNGAGYRPYKEEIVVEVEPVYIYIDTEKNLAALEVVPVSGIGGEDAVKEYLSLFTKCIGDLQKIVDREKKKIEKIEKIEREKREKEIAEYKKIVAGLIEKAKKMQQRIREAAPQGDKRIMKSGDEIEGRD